MSFHKREGEADSSPPPAPVEEPQDESAFGATATEVQVVLDPKLQAQLEHTRAQLRQLMQDKDELIGSTESLEQQLSALSAREMKIKADHRREVERLKVDLDAERTKASVWEESYTTAQVSIDTLKERVSFAERMVEDTSYECKDAKIADQDAEEAEELRAELEEMQLANAQLARDSRELAGKVSQAKKEAQDAAEERTKAIETLVQKNEALLEAEMQLEEADQRLLDMENECEDLRDELEDVMLTKGNSGGTRQLRGGHSSESEEFDTSSQASGATGGGGRGVPALSLTLNRNFEAALSTNRAKALVPETSVSSIMLHNDLYETPRVGGSGRHSPRKSSRRGSAVLRFIDEDFDRKTMKHSMASSMRIAPPEELKVDNNGYAIPQVQLEAPVVAETGNDVEWNPLSLNDTLSPRDCEKNASEIVELQQRVARGLNSAREQNGKRRGSVGSVCATDRLEGTVNDLQKQLAQQLQESKEQQAEIAELHDQLAHQLEETMKAAAMPHEEKLAAEIAHLKEELAHQLEDTLKASTRVFEELHAAEILELKEQLAHQLEDTLKATTVSYDEMQAAQVAILHEQLSKHAAEAKAKAQRDNEELERTNIQLRCVEEENAVLYSHLEEAAALMVQQKITGPTPDQKQGSDHQHGVHQHPPRCSPQKDQKRLDRLDLYRLTGLKEIHVNGVLDSVGGSPRSALASIVQTLNTLDAEQAHDPELFDDATALSKDANISAINDILEKTYNTW